MGNCCRRRGLDTVVEKEPFVGPSPSRPIQEENGEPHDPHSRRSRPVLPFEDKAFEAVAAEAKAKFSAFEAVAAETAKIFGVRLDDSDDE